MVNTNGMAGDEIGNLYARMANRVETFATQGEKFYNIIQALVKGDITLDRVKLLENHEIQILGEEPPDTPPTPPVAVNGKTEETAETSPLPDLQEGDELKVGAGSNGST